MKKVKPLKKLKKDLWTQFSKWVRKTEGGICFSCGKKVPDYYDRYGNLKEGWKAAQGGHFITGAICPPNLYFDERNVHCQCYHCNINLSGNWLNYEIKMIDKYGIEVVNELKSIAHQVVDWTAEDYEKRIAYYKKSFNDL